MRKKLVAMLICSALTLSVGAVVFANEEAYTPKTPMITEQFDLVPDAETSTKRQDPVIEDGSYSSEESNIQQVSERNQKECCKE